MPGSRVGRSRSGHTPHSRSGRPGNLAASSSAHGEIVLLVGVGIDQVAMPSLEARAVDPVDPVDALRVQLHVCQVLARVPGQGRVGVEVDDPVLELEVSQPDVDRQGSCEFLTVPLEIGAEAPCERRSACRLAIVPGRLWDVTTTQSSKSDWLTRMVCSRKSS